MLQSSVYLIKNEILFQINRFLKKESFNFDNGVQSIVKKIEKEGFAVFPNFYNTDECENLRNEIDTLIAQREKDSNLWSDSVSSDKRCHSAEEDSALIELFFNNDFLITVASNYAKLKMECSNTLASRIKYKKGNIGSGQGWHRDSNNFQFKAMVYLSDVEKKDGPFQILKGSHKFINIIKDTIIMGVNGASTRLGNDRVKRLIDRKPKIYKSLLAKEGTVIITDTSSIHTGMPLSPKGKRYSLTNYYYPSYDIKNR